MFKSLNKSKSQNSNTVLDFSAKYASCLIPSILIEIVGILVLTFSYYKMTEKPKALFFAVYCFIALSSFILGKFSHTKFKGRGIVVGILAVVPLILINLILISIFAKFNFSAFIFLIIPVSIIFGALGGIMDSNSKKRYM